MDTGMILQGMMILVGVLLLGNTLLSLARRRMTEPFVLTWGLISVIFILAGILLRPAEWNRYISPTGLLLMGLIGFCVLFGAYVMSAKISELTRRNLELAMQVSLVKQEMEELKSWINKKEKKERIS